MGKSNLLKVRNKEGQKIKGQKTTKAEINKAIINVTFNEYLKGQCKNELLGILLDKKFEFLSGVA